MPRPVVVLGQVGRESTEENFPWQHIKAQAHPQRLICSSSSHLALPAEFACHPLARSGNRAGRRCFCAATRTTRDSGAAEPAPRAFHLQSSRSAPRSKAAHLAETFVDPRLAGYLQSRAPGGVASCSLAQPHPPARCERPIRAADTFQSEGLFSFTGACSFPARITFRASGDVNDQPTYGNREKTGHSAGVTEGGREGDKKKRRNCFRTLSHKCLSSEGDFIGGRLLFTCDQLGHLP